MLPAVGSDKATAAEGGIAPDVMFICHTAGEGGIWSSCNPNFMSAAAVWLISLTKSTCSSPMISFIVMFHFKLSIFCHDLKQRWVRSSLKYPISQYFGGNCFVCSPLPAPSPWQIFGAGRRHAFGLLQYKTSLGQGIDVTFPFQGNSTPLSWQTLTTSL